MLTATGRAAKQRSGLAPVIPVVFCFDVEPDDREIALEPRPWLGFERLLDRIGPLREELAAVTGRPVRFNWFLRMDPQIADSHGNAGWVAERYKDHIQAWRTAGDAIGLHAHCWRWSRQRTRWVSDHGDPDWVDHCVRLSFDAYQDVFDEPCRAIRFGDRFLSPRAVRLAAQLGAQFDLTVEPGMPGVRALGRGTVGTGQIPSQTEAPREPYRPSVTDPVRRSESASDLGLWMIPLTAIDSSPLIPLWRRLARRALHPLGPRHRTAMLSTTWRTKGYWSIVERELESSPRPYLAFATRSDIFIRPPFNAGFEGKLAALRDWEPARRLSFVTPDAVVAALDAGPSIDADAV